MHPLDFLDFFQALCMKAAIVVAKDIKNQRIWAANPTCAATELVPFAVNRAKELSDAARSVQVTTVGLNQYVCQYYEAGTVAAHVRRTVNIGMGTCSCLEYQRYRFPCKDVFAGSCLCWLLFSCAYVTASFIFGLTALQATQGESWMTAFKRWDVYVDPCYKLYSDIVAKIGKWPLAECRKMPQLMCLIPLAFRLENLWVGCRYYICGWGVG
jgi:hypothetical protein